MITIEAWTAAEVFRHNFQTYLENVMAGNNPSRHVVDALRECLSEQEGDRISFEVEQELGLTATNPKFGN